MTNFLITFVFSFIFCWVALPVALAILKTINFYTAVSEGRCKVYLLFGRVLGVVEKPGLHLLWIDLGPQAALVRFFGRIYEIDRRLDQEYLRSNPVNSEEGTPMGVGVWYEMRFKNTDPQGSLRANVANATVRSLSNMPLEKLLENRHEMSRVVRQEVSPKSDEWGYQLGSVYIRKVHFRDSEMIRQIEHKVVNRLRQVTSAIRQAGTNQVDIITSAAERQSAAEFARARSVRPKLVGEALREIGQDPEVLDAVFETLEVDRIVKGNADVTLVPNGQYETLVSLLAGGTFGKPATDQPPPLRQ